MTPATPDMDPTLAAALLAWRKAKRQARLDEADMLRTGMEFIAPPPDVTPAQASKAYRVAQATCRASHAKAEAAAAGLVKALESAYEDVPDEDLECIAGARSR